MPKNGKSFIFPCADGSVKMSGRDEVFRTSTLKKTGPTCTRRGSTMMSFKESRTGLIQQINNERMTLKPETISGENLGIMFVAISFNQGSNFMCQTKGHSFHTTHLYRRCQAVEYDIGCLAGKSHRRLLERRWWLGVIRAMARYAHCMAHELTGCKVARHLNHIHHTLSSHVVPLFATRLFLIHAHSHLIFLGFTTIYILEHRDRRTTTTAGRSPLMRNVALLPS